MALTKEERDIALDHIKTHWKRDNTCSVCGESNWNIHPTLYEIREFNEGSMVVGGPLVPLIAVGCASCGNLKFFSAITAGLVNRPDKSK